MARGLMVLALALSTPILLAWGEEPLPDPTRPPAAVEAPQPGEAGSAVPVLQSVILGKGRKPMAIISGQRVELKGRFGEARLTRLSETEAVLDGPQGRQVLKLTPQAEKRRSTGDAKTPRAASQRKSPQP